MVLTLDQMGKEISAATQTLALAQRRAIGELLLSELRKPVGTLRRRKRMSEPKMGPTEFAAEVERLKAEGEVPKPRNFIGRNRRNASRVRPEDSRRTSGQKGERRSVVKRLLFCVNVNRTSLDHLLLGKNADVDQMSNNPSIARDRREDWSLNLTLQ
jgi:hypothetical protein